MATAKREEELKNGRARYEQGSGKVSTPGEEIEGSIV
jgi:hypothetical protein